MTEDNRLESLKEKLPLELRVRVSDPELLITRVPESPDTVPLKL